MELGQPRSRECLIRGEQGRYLGWLRALVLIDDVVKSLDQRHLMEIDQQSDLQVHQSQMRKSLHLVDRMDRRFCFELDDHLMLDK